jgi:dynamin 1-like protein
MTTLGDDLLGTVNKLQDLVFNTIGNDSLDLPQIVSYALGSASDPANAIHRLWSGRSLLASPLYSKISSAETSFPEEVGL